MNIYPSRSISNLFSQLTSVRWYRKPRWLPMAPSKVMKVPVKPDIDEEERKELLVLHNNYKTSMKSIRKFLIADYIRTKPNEIIDKISEEKIEKECKELNEAWNKEVALIREKRLTEKAALKKEKVLNKLMAAEIKQQKIQENAKIMIMKEKENSLNFITPENINIKIEEALENILDNTYAIDLQGNMHKGFGSACKLIENKNIS